MAKDSLNSEWSESLLILTKMIPQFFLVTHMLNLEK